MNIYEHLKPHKTHRLFTLLNSSAVIAAAALELVAITKKGRSCEIIKNFDPMWGQYASDKTLWSALLECYKQSNQPRANVKYSNQ